MAKEMTFIDLFSGCGGLSLGLMNAGWKGVFAVEQSHHAFKTLKHNLIEEGEHNIDKPRFHYPDWLEKEPFEIKDFLNKYSDRLDKLRGKIHLVAGGPPCQGFSMAGKRTENDPRNYLFMHHLQIVDILQPAFVLMENVQGIDIAFGSGRRTKSQSSGKHRKSYAKRIFEMLHEHGYRVQQHIFKAADFGVPQLRPRYFTLGIREDLLDTDTSPNLLSRSKEIRQSFLKERGLPVDRPVNVLEAISDLSVEGKQIIECRDEESPSGFKEIVYVGPQTAYQRLMHGDINGRSLNSLRLANHKPDTVQRFQKILKSCRKGVQLSDEDRARLGIKKNALVPLSPDMPSHTLTTLPDDYIHYKEPRIHTVREHARLQSFPDWFEFKGKYTTGGKKRKSECPRYTQVGNAVPPLLAEIIGRALLELL